MKIKRIKILFIFGTRPEVIKLAPVYNYLKRNKRFRLAACVTAQHKQMMFQALDIFNIKPNFNLDIMRHNQDLFDISSSILDKVKGVLGKFKPDLVVVHGDTTTAFVAALSAFYLNIRVAHIEAGLRTYNLQAPFPEELNRQLVSKIADLHFCPTKESYDNLIAERVEANKLFITGNTVIDALLQRLQVIEEKKSLKKKLSSLISNKVGFNLGEEDIILITGHRRENLGKGILDISNAVLKLAKKFPNKRFVYPVHLNPKVSSPVKRILSRVSNVSLIEPLDYDEFLFLMRNACLILTDSGGIQEEAPSLGIPVLVMRDTTERPEAVKAGVVKLVGSSQEKIIYWVTKLLEDKKMYKKMSSSINPYGDGRSSVRINEILEKYFEDEKS